MRMSVPRASEREITSSEGRQPAGKISSLVNERDAFSTS